MCSCPDRSTQLFMNGRREENTRELEIQTMSCYVDDKSFWFLLAQYYYKEGEEKKQVKCFEIGKTKLLL